jgi:hypothetical protein
VFFSSTPVDPPTFPTACSSSCGPPFTPGAAMLQGQFRLTDYILSGIKKPDIFTEFMQYADNFIPSPDSGLRFTQT